MLTLVRTTLERLERDIKHGILSSSLPGTIPLSKHYGVSQGTMAKVMRALRDRGTVVFQKGQRPQLKGARTCPDLPPRVPVSRNASGRVYRFLTDQMNSGTIRYGTFLPKVSAIAATHATSTRAVISALRILEDEGSVHKSGRQWRVGGSDTFPRSEGRFAPVVVLVAEDSLHLDKLFQSAFWGPFIRTFFNEADSRGVVLRTVLMDGTNSDAILPGGQKQIAELIHGLGTRYLGSMVLSAMVRFSVAALIEWVHFLDSFRRPVQYLSGITRWPDAETVLRKIPGAVACIIGEWGQDGIAGLSEKVIALLAQSGHTKAGFVYLNPSDQGWAKDRLRLFRAESLRLNRPVQFTSAGSIRKSIDPENRQLRLSARYKLVARHLRLTDASVLTKADIELLRTGIVVEPLLGVRGLTILVAGNDACALAVYRYLVRSGRRIPKDISLLSFDNLPLIRTLPISSFDLGQTSLGYRSLHQLLGDLPGLSKRKTSQLVGEPLLNHSDSVALLAKPR